MLEYDGITVMERSGITNSGLQELRRDQNCQESFSFAANNKNDQNRQESNFCQNPPKASRESGFLAAFSPRPTVKRVSLRGLSGPRIPTKRLKSGKRRTKVTDLRVMIAKVTKWATLPPGPRIGPKSDVKVTKSDVKSGKVDHFLDHSGPLSYRRSRCQARDRFPEGREH